MAKEEDQAGGGCGSGGGDGGDGGFIYKHRVQAFTEKDTIVLADFANTTGDAVFDDSLRQGLAVDLAQSPFLNILSEQKVRQALRLMGRSPNERVTRELAQEICERQGSKAYLAGSISALGSSYSLVLDAVNCRTGDSLARERVEADSKEHVLPALGEAATKLRRELGESLASIEKFDVPLQKATTPSLEALRAYTLGYKATRLKGPVEAIPFYKRAVELDPNFAWAYHGLGLIYGSLGETGAASEYAKRAFELRDRASEREKLEISAFYYFTITGDLEQASQIYQLSFQSYPRDSAAHLNLGVNYIVMGQFEKAAAETRESLQLDSNSVTAYGNLGNIYLALNRFDEAKATVEQALARNLDSVDLRQDLYALAFLQGDAKAMEQQVAWAAGRLGKEDLLLSLQSDTEAYAGHVEKARGLSPPRGGGRETLRSERACGGLGSQRGPAGSAVWQRCAGPPARGSRPGHRSGQGCAGHGGPNTGHCRRCGARPSAGR